MGEGPGRGVGGLTDPCDIGRGVAVGGGTGFAIGFDWPPIVTSGLGWADTGSFFTTAVSAMLSVGMIPVAAGLRDGISDNGGGPIPCRVNGSSAAANSPGI